MLKIIPKLIKYPYRLLIKLRFLNEKGLKNKFSTIYNNNYWDNKESLSGPGSSLKNTKNLRKKLPIIIKKYGIRSIVDAPCGDCNWIQHIIKKSQIKYTGIDIVKKCIDNNKLKFKDKNFSFKQMDITKDKLPRADLFICRDFIFHLSFKDTYKFLLNLKKLKTKYILFSSHTKSKTEILLNKDIKSGDFRKINLFNTPYNFKEKYEIVINDNCDGVKKYLILFKKKDFVKFHQYMQI
jgi:2-polyprenyl-3-methyl-5-hydroxy-6-metoxy-1,4-benzoquinol methylase